MGQAAGLRPREETFHEAGQLPFTGLDLAYESPGSALRRQPLLCLLNSHEC